MIKRSSHIRFRNRFEKQINSRANVDLIFNLQSTHQILKDSRIVYVDLKGIEFISRASAHQLLLKINEFKDNEIVFLNMSQEVSEMISVVRNSMERNFKSTPTVTNLAFSKSSDVEDYIMNI